LFNSKTLKLLSNWPKPQGLLRVRPRVTIRNKKQEWTKKWTNLASILTLSTSRKLLRFKKKSQITKNSTKQGYLSLKIKYTLQMSSRAHLLSLKLPLMTLLKNNCQSWARVSKNWTVTFNLKIQLKLSLRQPRKYPKSSNQGTSHNGLTQTKIAGVSPSQRSHRTNQGKPLRAQSRMLCKRRWNRKRCRSMSHLARWMRSKPTRDTLKTWSRRPLI